MHFKESYRRDIDGLRAVAVVAVILNHFYQGVLPSGFLGVDIFFVISGYVITQSLVSQQYSSWSEYLLGFYTKRIRRLLPALFFCVFITLLVLLFLSASVRKEIFNTGATSLLGLSNVYLYYIASDYFSVDATLNPFTHTWSLGVEEQFYFVYPFLLAWCGLVFSRKRNGNPRALLLLAALSLISFSLYFFSYHLDPVASFYLMPMRFWELCLGGLVFLFGDKFGFLKKSYWSALCFFSIMCVLFFPAELRLYTTVVCAVCTAGLIVSAPDKDFFGQVLSSRLFVYIGTLSYSLYLWHWVVLVLGRYALGDSNSALLFLLFLSFFLSLVSYHCVERPLRYASFWQGMGRPFVVSSILVLPFIYLLVWKIPDIDTSKYSLMSLLGIEKSPSWAGKISCHGKNSIETGGGGGVNCLKPDRTQNKPNVIFLLGDSHAAQLTFMLDLAAQELPFSVKFANKESDEDFPKGSVLGVTKNANLEYVLKHSKAGDLIVLSMHRGRLNKSRDSHLDLLHLVDSNKLSKNLDSVMSPYIKKFSELGIKVVLVRDTPLMKNVADSEACNMQLRLWGKSMCSVSREQDLHTRTRLDRIYDRWLLDSKVYDWDPSALMYSAKGDVDVVDEHGQYIMMDAHHITRYQSLKLAMPFRVFLINEVLSND
jgi:peptidoglycan/LPS O-acetylase OafA/YrhL